MRSLACGQRVFLTLVLVFISFAFLVYSSDAATTQQEVVSIVAYFPTPDGVFRTLHITSTSGCDDSAACSTPGEICWNSSYNNYFVCSEKNPGEFAWQTPDIWKTSDATDPPTLFYGEQNRPDRIGIGTINPQSTLDVNGTSNTCVMLSYTNNSGMTSCPSGFVTLTGINASGLKGVFGTGYFMCCAAKKNYKFFIYDPDTWG